MSDGAQTQWPMDQLIGVGGITDQTWNISESLINLFPQKFLASGLLKKFLDIPFSRSFRINVPYFSVIFS
jgi:hypothetical protein